MPRSVLVYLADVTGDLRSYREDAQPLRLTSCRSSAPHAGAVRALIRLRRPLF